jgi:regulator of replication initiation timing
LSALTKIAVILLVVTSLLLSAGVVVFVNKVDHFERVNTASEASLLKERTDHANTRAQYTAANQSLLDQAKDFNTREGALRTEIATLTKTVGDRDTAIAKLDQDKKGVEVALANLTKVQEGLQGQLAASQTQVSELRKIRDQLVDERHALNVQLTDALAKVDALDRAHKNAQEQAAGARAQAEEVMGRISANPQLARQFQRSPTAPPQSLEGVVKDVFEAGGKPWVSVSIGAKDNVSKGMKFNVVNNNEFLGYLTIQTTEPNEAAGVLDGPKVQKVRQGDQVKTQLQ